MPTVKTGDDPYRLQFEEVYGKVIRHDHWLKIRAEMAEVGLSLTYQNVSFYAHFKSLCPRKPLTKAAISKLNKFTSGYKGKTLLGSELKDLIEKDGAGGALVYKPFYQAGFSFKGTSRYSFEAAYKILTYAYTTRRKQEESDDRG